MDQLMLYFTSYNCWRKIAFGWKKKYVKGVICCAPVILNRFYPMIACLILIFYVYIFLE